MTRPVLPSRGSGFIGSRASSTPIVGAGHDVRVPAPPAHRDGRDWREVDGLDPTTSPKELDAASGVPPRRDATATTS